MYKVDEDSCVACGACEGMCPAGAITVDGCASINQDSCVECGSCAGGCPVGAIKQD